MGLLAQLFSEQSNAITSAREMASNAVQNYASDKQHTERLAFDEMVKDLSMIQTMGWKTPYDKLIKYDQEAAILGQKGITDENTGSILFGADAIEYKYHKIFKMPIEKLAKANANEISKYGGSEMLDAVKTGVSANAARASAYASQKQTPLDEIKSMWKPAQDEVIQWAANNSKVLEPELADLKKKYKDPMQYANIKAQMVAKNAISYMDSATVTQSMREALNAVLVAAANPKAISLNEKSLNSLNDLNRIQQIALYTAYIDGGVLKEEAIKLAEQGENGLQAIANDPRYGERLAAQIKNNTLENYKYGLSVGKLMHSREITPGDRTNIIQNLFGVDPKKIANDKNAAFTGMFSNKRDELKKVAEDNNMMYILGTSELFAKAFDDFTNAKTGLGGAAINNIGRTIKPPTNVSANNSNTFYTHARTDKNNYIIHAAGAGANARNALKSLLVSNGYNEQEIENTLIPGMMNGTIALPETWVKMGLAKENSWLKEADGSLKRYNNRTKSIQDFSIPVIPFGPKTVAPNEMLNETGNPDIREQF